MQQKLALKTVGTAESTAEHNLPAITFSDKSVAFGWFMCAIGTLFYFYEFLLRVSPSVMTSHLSIAYHVAAGGLGGLSASYYFAYAPMQFFVGILMDRYGPRSLLMGACMICMLGTYLFACSRFLGLAEFGRFMVGFGSAFAFVGVLKLATLWLPTGRFAVISGLTMALGMIGGLVGEDLLSVLVDHMGWQKTCYFSAMAGIPLVLLMFFFLRDGFKSGRAAENEQQLPDLRSAFVGLYKIISDPQIWIVGGIGCLLYLPTSAFAELWAVPFFEQVYHFDSEVAARVSSIIFLGWAFGGFVVGWASNKLQQRRLPITIGSTVAAILLSIVLYVPNFSPFTVALTLFVFGVFSSAQVLVFAIGHEITCSKSAGTAIALTNMFVMLGGFVFQPVIGKILDLLWEGNLANGVRIYSTVHWQAALSVLPIGLVLTLLLSFFLKETHCRQVEG